MILHLLLLILTLSPTLAFPQPSSIPIANLTSPNSLTSLSMEGKKPPECYCTRQAQWTQPLLLAGDCRGTLALFYYETMGNGGKKSLEFVSVDMPTRKYIQVQRTPRKYTFGTCTLAIVMIDDFPTPSSLPGGIKTGPPTDTATYYNLNRLATNLVERCILRDGEAGWQLTGYHDGIGLFIWSTDSPLDSEFQDDTARLTLPVSETSGNRSVAMS